MKEQGDHVLSRREFLKQLAAGTVAAGALVSGEVGGAASPAPAAAGEAVALPRSVRAVWGLSKAFREETPTRGRVCVNGLWRWQPAKDASEPVPSDEWGYYKVPGDWPGASDYMHKESQTLYSHPAWRDTKLGEVTAAWYQREITIPADWEGRRIALTAEVVNSYAAVYVNGEKAGEILFPAGEVDLTAMCRPGQTYLVSLLVVALPLRGVMLSYSDTAAAKEVRGTVTRRGLCGDLFLTGAPAAARFDDVRVDTSVRKGELSVNAALVGLGAGAAYALRAEVRDGERRVHTLTSAPFRARDLKGGHFTFSGPWRAEKVWDIHTPQNTYQLTLTLLDAAGRPLDVALPVRFGYREFWIDGKDFYLNGTRLFLSAAVVRNAGVSAAASTYEAARESLRRLKDIGINFVYTHNYGCEPGTHLSFEEILRAADDVGMLVSFSQPHFGQYDWKAANADATNGYARHAAYYVRAAGSHPSVVCYVMSHNGLGYGGDMDPDLIDGVHAPAGFEDNSNVKAARRAEAIVMAMDPARFVYHHASGNVGVMHDVNFYPNMAPIQELSDWLEHWATTGVKPFFTCEYAAPYGWDWTMYRGWYRGTREFGSAAVPWEFCQAEWSAQYLGGRCFRLTEAEKANLRWEARQFREGKLWHHWDYPHEVGAKMFDDQHAIRARYTTDNWRAFRTWGMSANSPSDYDFFWRLRDPSVRRRRNLPVEWEHLQRPGFSPDYLGDRFECLDMAYEVSDWEPTADARALLRNNLPLLAYLAGKPARFTSQDHLFHPGERVEKQLIVINNSRETVTCDWEWSVSLPEPQSGRGQEIVKTGEQARFPFAFTLPSSAKPGACEIAATVRFSTGETQTDAFTFRVLPRPAVVRTGSRIALFDPKGETARALRAGAASPHPVEAGADLSGYDLLIIGKGALTLDGPAPDLGRVRGGLRVIVFEQAAEALEKRLGFRATEYGLRQIFPRVPDHPALGGLTCEELRDWQGEATLTPPRLPYPMSEDVMVGAPVMNWCGIPVTRVWRCGNRGNVASVLIEKPARGGFLPLADGGYGLQYSPLLEYREGKGMILFCQLDVTGRSEPDPAADTLLRRVLQYAADWKPAPRRTAVYVGDPAGARYFGAAGLGTPPYTGGTLSEAEVLVVGPGGGRAVAPHATELKTWVESGGHLLALGLDEVEAKAFLPFSVSTTRAEYIGAAFDPFPLNSPFAGVCPGDLLSRDPRELPLISGGATVVDNGVLAAALHGNVVFCQVVPWQFDWRQPGRDPKWPGLMNLKRTYRRQSVLVSRLLGNMGVFGNTPLLDHFSTPVGANEQRWLEGLYLDQPEEWDDPYRFFRW